MSPLTDSLSVYRELAGHYERLGQAAMRDRFLILAADAALQAGQSGEAERLRQQLLQASRHHMLRSYASFAEAAAAPDVQSYLRDLRANYPLETAREMLGDLQPPPDHDDGSNGPIPPTAPLIDLYAQPNRPQPWQPRGLTDPYPLHQDMGETPSPRKPLAQPLPGRVPQGRPVPSRADSRPPVAAPAPLPIPMRDREDRRDAHGSNSARWFSVALGSLAFLAAVAAAAYTLARPFLP